MIAVYVNNRGIVMEVSTLAPSCCTHQNTFPKKRVFNNFLKLSRVLDKVVSGDDFAVILIRTPGRG